MKNVSATLTVALLGLFLPCLAYSQGAKAPIYKDGDWWKIKYKVTHGSAPGSCKFEYAEYFVRIVNGSAKVYGVRGTSQDRIKCSGVANDLMGTGDEFNEFAKILRFPLDVGKNWKKRISREMGPRIAWAVQKVKVLGLEKVQLAGGDVEAYKLTRSHTFTSKVKGELTWHDTYYYSPKAKAIVLKTAKNPKRVQVFTVVDFGVSN